MIRSVWKRHNFPFWNWFWVFLFLFYIHLGLSSFWYYLGLKVHVLILDSAENNLTDESLSIKTRIWHILLILSDCKWCIHRGRSFSVVYWTKKKKGVTSLSSRWKWIYGIWNIIKWSGISPSFARLWLAETAFTRVYLRVNWPLTAFSGLFGVSIFS